MPSLKNLNLLALCFGMALASPNPMHAKRQFLAPPSGCEDPSAFSRCASQSPLTCANPLPGSIAACLAFCEPCCSGDAGVGCPNNGESENPGSENPDCMFSVASGDECTNGCFVECFDGSTIEGLNEGTATCDDGACWQCDKSLCD